MSTYTFVTRANRFSSDDTCSVDILSEEDIRRIVYEKTKPLINQIYDMKIEIRDEIRELKEKNVEQEENLKKQEENLKKIIGFLVGDTQQAGIEKIALITKKGETVYASMEKVLANEKKLQNLPKLLQTLPDDCKKLFYDTIKEVLEPHYLTLTAETQKLLEQKTRIEDIEKAKQQLEDRQNETQASFEDLQKKMSDVISTETQKQLELKIRLEAIEEAKEQLELRQNEIQASCEDLQKKTTGVFSKIKEGLKNLFNIFRGPRP